MKADEYQRLARRTTVDKPGTKLEDLDIMISWNALGLAGEAGEVADLVKKGIFHQQGLDHAKLKKELGDVLWYLSALCDNLGYTLAEVMQTNITKLEARYPDGFSPDRSTFREGNAE